MDRAHWRSPAFRGRPRFRGGGGDAGHFGTPRNYSPQWQQRTPSPYRFQSGGSPYGGPQMRSPYDSQSFITYTPLHSSGGGGGRRPFFRGGGRFNKRQSFGSNSLFDRSGQSGNNIENWISPEMWSDPWSHLVHAPGPDSSYSQIDETTTAGTKFAESDFDFTDKSAAEQFQEQSEEDTH